LSQALSSRSLELSSDDRQEKDTNDAINWPWLYETEESLEMHSLIAPTAMGSTM
jgi:hypothetical protein